VLLGDEPLAGKYKVCKHRLARIIILLSSGYSLDNALILTDPTPPTKAEHSYQSSHRNPFSIRTNHQLDFLVNFPMLLLLRHGWCLPAGKQVCIFTNYGNKRFLLKL